MDACERPVPTLVTSLFASVPFRLLARVVSFNSAWLFHFRIKGSLNDNKTKHTFTKEFNHNYIIYQPNIHIQLNYVYFIPIAPEINLFVLFQSFQRIRINKTTQLKINYTVSPLHFSE